MKENLLTPWCELLFVNHESGEMTMRDLNFLLKRLCARNKDGSYQTQAARERILTLVANQLYEAGFRHMLIDSLKPKHVDVLVERWKAADLSAGTIKNRLSEIRWWAEKVNKQNVVARSNDYYGIERRVYVTNMSKARTLEAVELERVNDPHTRMSLRLQAEFGLRREESIKIRPAQADRGNRLVLQASWTKGGRARELPIRTAAQRQVLSEAHQLAGTGSLIPRDKIYVQQLRRFEYQCAKAGIDRVHGHRHCYAQRRYKEITGRDCPATGGRTSNQLTAAEKALDHQARLTISTELGHGREQITATYLGR
jgi:site-specific recombinase XerC